MRGNRERVRLTIPLGSAMVVIVFHQIILAALGILAGVVLLLLALTVALHKQRNPRKDSDSVLRLLVAGVLGAFLEHRHQQRRQAGTPHNWVCDKCRRSPGPSFDGVQATLPPGRPIGPPR
jgi:hypothetical protein